MIMTIGACSEVKKLDSMRESTTEMRDTTKELLEVSKEMNKTTKELAATSDQMGKRMEKMEEKTVEMKALTEGLSKQSAEIYDASRQGMAMTSRRELLEATYKSESGGQKAVLAALYFKAFEFHLWTGADKDATEEKRLALMKDAVREFFRAIQEFDEDSRGPDPIAKRNADAPLHDSANKHATFNSLALAMHESNSKQEEMLHEHKNLSLITMYSMIVESLVGEKKATATSKELPEYQQIVLENKELAIKLLQARHNILLAVFIKETLKKTIVPAQPEPPPSSVADSFGRIFSKWIEKGKAAANIYLPPAIPGIPFRWDLDLERYNLQQTLVLTKYLKGCLQTRSDLGLHIGVRPVVHGHVETIFKGLRIVGGEKGAKELLEARSRLRETIEMARAPSTTPH
jgi:hypothetical protein